MNKVMLLAASIVAVAALPASGVAFAQFLREAPTAGSGFQRLVVEDEEYGYFLSTSKWTSGSIEVCWEQTAPDHEADRKLVERAISETWERYSQLDFSGWTKCPEANYIGIRIRTADEHPHVEALGAAISGTPAGMVLNFDYGIEAFRTCAKSSEMKELCTRAIAVHEFGHAIGFAHEHNRLDRDGACSKRPQGTPGDTLLTPYDPDSVMNYCNPLYGNLGKLSYWDIVALQQVYGKPQ